MSGVVVFKLGAIGPGERCLFVCRGLGLAPGLGIGGAVGVGEGDGFAGLAIGGIKGDDCAGGLLAGGPRGVSVAPGGGVVGFVPGFGGDS